jgi:hypothetical protein
VIEKNLIRVEVTLTRWNLLLQLTYFLGLFFETYFLSEGAAQAGVIIRAYLPDQV